MNEEKNKSFDKVIKRPRQHEIHPVKLKTRPPRRAARILGSPLFLLTTFIGLIIVVTILLFMPFSNTTNTFTPFLTAFFTATSVVTMTGLTVVNTGDYWSTTGQGIILGAMLIAGLGFMTLATFLIIVSGQRITLSERMLIRDTMGMDRIGGLVRLTISIIIYALIFYSIGSIILFWRLLEVFEPLEAGWHAIFHAVSSFNNAGFTTFSGNSSLASFSTDKIFMSSMLIAMFFGSISWPVVADIYRKKRFSRFTLDTKVVLVTALGLTIIGSGVVFLGEFGRDSFGDADVGEKILLSVFHSQTSRSAGFSTFDYNNINDLTSIFTAGLMFIGGAVASTAGGIKLTTIAIITATVLCSVRGRSRVEMFGREIPFTQVHRAIAIAFLGIIAIFLVSLILTITEPDQPFLRILFETVSAFAICGLTNGLTQELSTFGNIIFIIAMFIGRLGPITFVLALIPNEHRELYRFAQERVKIG